MQKFSFRDMVSFEHTNNRPPGPDPRCLPPQTPLRAPAYPVQRFMYLDINFMAVIEV